jgi:hypothetical protein
MRTFPKQDHADSEMKGAEKADAGELAWNR